METNSKTVISAIILLLASLVSNVFSHRMSNHIYFQVTRNDTTTTTSPTEGVIVGDKLPGPSVSFPIGGDSFLNYLLQRPTYFDKNGPVGKNNDASNTETIGTSRSTTQNPTTTSARTATTTQTTTTTTRIVSTIRGNQMFNEDGSVNLNRPVMMVFSGKQTEEPRERQGQLQAADLWLQKYRRPSVLDTVQSRSRSNDDESSNTPNVDIVSLSPTTSRPVSNNNGAVQIDSNGAVYIVRGKPTAAPRQNDINGDKQGPDTVDVQDKPFYGTSQGWLFNDRSSDDGFDTTAQDSTWGVQGSFRHKRAITADVNGTSCNQTRQFQPCQFYPQCFPELVETCKTRDSYIGDKFHRFCSTTIETTKSVQSDVLKTYLRNVEQCLRDELLLVLESPSCDDVTLALSRALLVKSRSSCLYQGGMFCSLTEDDEARPALARMLNLPTDDVDFMARLMVNFGDLTYFCRGQGSSIFVTDLIMLATGKDSPYKNKFSNTPIPGIVTKF